MNNNTDNQNKSRNFSIEPFVFVSVPMIWTSKRPNRKVLHSILLSFLLSHHTLIQRLGPYACAGNFQVSHPHNFLHAPVCLADQGSFFVVCESGWMQPCENHLKYIPKQMCLSASKYICDVNSSTFSHSCAPGKIALNLDSLNQSWDVAEHKPWLEKKLTQIRSKSCNIRDAKSQTSI